MSTFKPFYPASRQEIINACSLRKQDQQLKALVVPHAAFRFSGAVAGKAYSFLKNASFSTIVLIGPSHHVSFNGVAVPAKDLVSPFGTTKLSDKLELIKPYVITYPELFQTEHSLAVQLPFLQVLAPDAAVIPLLIGETTVEHLASLVSHVYDARTLLVVTSDLGYYHAYEDACVEDKKTMHRILRGKQKLSKEQACCSIGIEMLRYFAEKYTWKKKILGYANSGDMGATKDHVVGYPAIVFLKGSSKNHAHILKKILKKHSVSSAKIKSAKKR